MARVFKVTETVTRTWEVTLDDDLIHKAVAYGGDRELELLASDATHDPAPGRRVELMSMEMNSEVSPPAPAAKAVAP